MVNRDLPATHRPLGGTLAGAPATAYSDSCREIEALENAGAAWSTPVLQIGQGNISIAMKNVKSALGWNHAGDRQNRVSRIVFL